MFLGMQEGFAAPEDEEIDEQAHLDQDEYWVLPYLPIPSSLRSSLSMSPFSCPSTLSSAFTLELLPHCTLLISPPLPLYLWMPRMY